MRIRSSRRASPLAQPLASSPNDRHGIARRLSRIPIGEPPLARVPFACSDLRRQSRDRQGDALPAAQANVFRTLSAALRRQSSAAARRRGNRRSRERSGRYDRYAGRSPAAATGEIIRSPTARRSCTDLDPTDSGRSVADGSRQAFAYHGRYGRGGAGPVRPREARHALIGAPPVRRDRVHLVDLNL
jgi:hypothetical protein